MPTTVQSNDWLFIVALKMMTCRCDDDNDADADEWVLLFLVKHLFIQTFSHRVLSSTILSLVVHLSTYLITCLFYNIKILLWIYILGQISFLQSQFRTHTVFINEQHFPHFIIATYPECYDFYSLQNFRDSFPVKVILLKL